MFLFVSGPIITPFMPKANMPLTLPLYMSSQMWVQE